MKQPRMESRATSRTGVAREERGSVMARHASEGTGIGRLLALARRLGNQAIQRVLGESRDDDASVATGSGGDAGAVERLARTLGTDPSGVRVVDDPTSHAAADALGASALTVGDTVLLGRDAPPPSTPAREHLLAHELAHVAQQRASGTVCDTVGAPDDAHELSARAAAASAVRGDRSTLSVAGAGPPPAVQLQRKKRNEGLDRAAAQQRLEAYFTRVLAEQGGRSVRMTDDVKGTLRRIFLNDMQGLLTFDTFLTGTAFPGSPAELAAAVAKYLPDPIDASRLAHLDLPSAGSTKLGRVKDLAKSTEPYVSPETQQQQWEFDRQAKEARRNDQTVIGPFGVDLNRILNIGKGLPKALEGPKRQKQTGEPNATLDATIASIDPHSLTPAAARGGPKAGDYADAQLVARAIADELNRAQAAKDKRITLRLDALYAGVEDRDSIIAEVARIARLVRDALPHKASEVRALDLYFGNKIVRQISLAGAAEKTEGSQ